MKRIRSRGHLSRNPILKVRSIDNRDGGNVILLLTDQGFIRALNNHRLRKTSILLIFILFNIFYASFQITRRGRITRGCRINIFDFIVLWNVFKALLILDKATVLLQRSYQVQFFRSQFGVNIFSTRHQHHCNRLLMNSRVRWMASALTSGNST